LTLLVFGLLALTSQRQVVWWGFVAGPILASYAAALTLPGWLPRTQPPPTSHHGAPLSPRPCEGEGSPTARLALSCEGEGGTLANWLLAGLLTVLALFSPLWRPALADRLDGGTSAALATPTRIAEAAATLPEGARMFVFQPWTGYVAWRLWPHQQSMTDARFEAHPSWVWDEYQAVSTGRADWEQILQRYQVEYLVLEGQQQAFLADLALQTGRWVPLYRDEIGVILARANAE
jgi:hypothetical protein